ncbi:DNA methyltransferase [Trueperella pyogenes]|uniref:DNA methyltransferase n=1 Tax=Trueperella pyogenes TaxID=1661 RepID=UPI00345C9268
MARLNVRDIEERVDKLAGREHYDREFLFDLLLAYGKSPATVTRLKNGNLNVAQDSRDVLLKKVVLFRATDGDPLVDLEELKDSPLVARFSPRFVIVTNFEELAAIDLKTSERILLPIEKINEQVAFFLPWVGMEKVQYVSEAHADVKAAERMGRLYDELLKSNPDIVDDAEGRHSLNVFFTRLLFCFFAEDTKLFSSGLFTTTVGSMTAVDGSDVADLLGDLFIALDTEKPIDKPSRLREFPYVNGRLFTQREGQKIPHFSAKARTALLELGTLNWSEINPDIFGSMFQAIVDPEQRSGLGQHYTSVPNILKTIEPLFLDELKDEFDRGFDRPKKLEELLDRLAKIKIFDPACGSGNFLIIAYKELRRLELAILERLEEISPKHRNRGVDSVIHIENFYGIEIDDFAVEVAVLSLWIAKHQMNNEFERKFGLPIPLIPLKEAGRIVAGNAARLDWSEVCPNNGAEEIYLIGNPPFKGASAQSRQMKEDFEIVFRSPKYPKNLDYVSIWFILGASYISRTNASFAFISTNSIAQGQHVELLYPIIREKGLEYAFCYTGFPWRNNAKDEAGVTVVVVGVRNVAEAPKFIFQNDLRMQARNINGYLIDATEIVVVKRPEPLSDGLPEMLFGSKAVDHGGLIMAESEKDTLVDLCPRASNFLKSFVGAQDFIDSTPRYCLWITRNTVESALELPEIRKRIEVVRRYRENSKKVATRKLAAVPYRFAEPRYRPTDAIIVPSVSSERRDYVPIGFVGPDTVISNLAFAVYDAEPWLFAILTSRMHMAWLRAVGGALETRFRYSNTIVYNNFPVPDGALTDHVKEELTQAALRVLDVREYHSESTLAELYDRDAMPQNLRESHARVDELVDRLYSAKPYLTDEERLSDLFALYEKMSSEADAKVRKAKGKK